MPNRDFHPPPAEHFIKAIKQRGLRVGDPESRAIELYGEDYLWYTFGYEQQDGVITRIGFFTYYDAWGTDAVIAPPPVDYLPEN